MRRLGLIAIPLVLAGTSVACSESHGDDEDGGIEFPDGAVLPDTGTPVPGPVCGNGELEPGEMCDDGNDVDDDSCNNDCRRNGYCGDGTVDGDEVCDDGNNRSGDGCRSDCMSDETCGNGVLDVAAGEVCDGSDGCSDTCDAVASCGDGPEVPPSAPGDVCDDLNTTPFDGCDASCRDEIAMVIAALNLASRTEGCDLNGDGTIDNAFARALGLLSGLLGGFINNAIADGSLTLLMAFLGLDDAAGANDPDLRVAWLQGQDVDGDVSNNFGGDGQFIVSRDSLDPVTGAPLTSVQSMIASSMLTGGPEDIPLPLPIPIDLRQAQIRGTTAASGGQLHRLGTEDEPGLLCGGVPVSLLALFGSFVGDNIELQPPCDGSSEQASLADLIIAGGEAMALGFPLQFMATAPDLDLDADGLEGFRIQGGEDCQPVVIGCTDGDGTAIDGRGCFSDPRIADGYSAAFTFRAIRAQLVPAPAP